MNEGEKIEIEHQGQESAGKNLIEEVKAKALEKQKMWQDAQEEDQAKGSLENINKNAQNFWHFFEKIPSERHSSLDTPEKLIEALNEAGGNFVSRGEKFSVNDGFWQVFEIHPPSAMDDKIFDVCSEKRYAMMAGTNFWDNPPQVGHLFIPAIYLVKRKDTK